MATKNTTTVRFQDSAGIRKRRVFQYTGPASYATGGDTLTATELGLSAIECVLGLTISNGTLVLIGWWNRSTGKIMWFDSPAGAGGTLTQVANATNLSTFTGFVEVVGL